jgi:DNA-binding CsgD family transcriptional regulator
MPAALLPLYRAARQGAVSAFAAEAFATIGRALSFDRGLMFTTPSDRPAFSDVHTHGYDDPRALFASWARISHLDVLSKRVLAGPFEVHHLDLDAPQLARPKYRELRAHLTEFRLAVSICIAIPMPESRCATVLLLSRASVRRFTEHDTRALASVAPHVAEAAAICRVLALANHPDVGIQDLPIALVDPGGCLQETTLAFRRAIYGVRPPSDPHLPPEALRALRAGVPFALDDARSLEAWRDDDGRLLVRVCKRRRVDHLSARELDVARRFAEGESHTTIAHALGIAPTTVRNHIRHVYEKLGVNHRVALISALAE